MTWPNVGIVALFLLTACYAAERNKENLSLVVAGAAAGFIQQGFKRPPDKE